MNRRLYSHFSCGRCVWISLSMGPWCHWFYSNDRCADLLTKLLRSVLIDVHSWLHVHHFLVMWLFQRSQTYNIHMFVVSYIASMRGQENWSSVPSKRFWKGLFVFGWICFEQFGWWLNTWLGTVDCGCQSWYFQTQTNSRWWRSVSYMFNFCCSSLTVVSARTRVSLSPYTCRDSSAFSEPHDTNQAMVLTLRTKYCIWYPQSKWLICWWGAYASVLVAKIGL